MSGRISSTVGTMPCLLTVETFVSVSRYFIKTWDVASQKMRLFTSAGAAASFEEFAISPDGEKIAIGRDPWIESPQLPHGCLLNTDFSIVILVIPTSLSVQRGDGSQRVDTRRFSFLDLENPENFRDQQTDGELDIDDSTIVYVQ